MNKTIWMCWFQGEDDPEMPKLNRKCINRWIKFNPDYDVNILSDSNIMDYVPEFYDIIAESPNRSHAAKSDLLRLLLLSKFGGVWVDASLYPMLPLSQFYDKVVNQTGFFTYRFTPRQNRGMGNRETVSWFLCSERPRHYLIEQWKESFIKTFKHASGAWKYFALHTDLCDLYDNNARIKNIINNMVQISESIPHSALGNWKSRKDSYVYKRPNLDFNK